MPFVVRLEDVVQLLRRGIGARGIRNALKQQPAAYDCFRLVIIRPMKREPPPRVVLIAPHVLFDAEFAEDAVASHPDPERHLGDVQSPRILACKVLVFPEPLDLERGKATAQIGKVITVLAALGCELQIRRPDGIVIAGRPT